MPNLLEIVLENKGDTLKKENTTIGDVIDLSIQIFGGRVEVHSMGWGTNQRDGGIMFALRRWRIVNIVHIKKMLGEGGVDGLYMFE